MKKTGQVVLISADRANWGLPAGRTKGAGIWAETLRREVREADAQPADGGKGKGDNKGNSKGGH